MAGAEAGGQPEADLLEAAQHAALPQWAQGHAAPPAARFAGALRNREEISLSSSSSSSSSSISRSASAEEDGDEGDRGPEVISGDGQDADVADAGARLDALIRSKGWEALDGRDEDSGDEAALRSSRAEPEVPSVDPVDAAAVAVAELSLAGTVMSVVEGTVVVAGTEGRAAFDNGSVLCLEDRTVLGRVTDVFGPIESPFYSVQGGEGMPAAVQAGAQVMAVAGQSERLLPETVRTAEGPKSRGDGGDGSDEEQWFSDDEVEETSKVGGKQGNGQAGKTGRDAGAGGRGKGRGVRKNRRGGGPKPAPIAPYPGMPLPPGSGVPFQAPPLPGAAPSPYGAWAGYAPPPPGPPRGP